MHFSLPSHFAFDCDQQRKFLLEKSDLQRFSPGKTRRANEQLFEIIGDIEGRRKGHRSARINEISDNVPDGNGVRIHGEDKAKKEIGEIGCTASMNRKIQLAFDVKKIPPLGQEQEI